VSIFEGNRQDVNFDGKDLSMWYDLYVVDLDSNKENQFGIKKSITYNGNTFVKTDGLRYVIDVTFARIIRGIPQEIDEDDLDELILLFFRKDEPVAMQVEGRLYYVVPIEGSIIKIRNKYFTITLESVSPYCYTLPRHDHYRRIKDRVIERELNNKGITDVFTDVEFKGSAEKIVVRNKTNGNYIEITDVVDVDVNINGDTLEVTGLDYDKVQGNVRETLRMSYGVNRYSIEVVGEVEFQFIHQCEMGLV
jgi:hypothetical protein